MAVADPEVGGHFDSMFFGGGDRNAFVHVCTRNMRPNSLEKL